MSEEELIETLRAFEKNRVEQLEEPARNLFYAIMKIAGERDRLNKALLDIKEYIETFEEITGITNRYDYRVKEKLLDIVNKALGSDKE